MLNLFPTPALPPTVFRQLYVAPSCYITSGLAEVDPTTKIFYFTALSLVDRPVIGTYRKILLIASLDAALGCLRWRPEYASVGVYWADFQVSICGTSHSSEGCTYPSITQSKTRIAATGGWKENALVATIAGLAHCRVYEWGVYLIAA